MMLESSHPVWNIQNVGSEISVRSSIHFISMLYTSTHSDVLCYSCTGQYDRKQVVSYLLTDAGICMLLK